MFSFVADRGHRRYRGVISHCTMVGPLFASASPARFFRRGFSDFVRPGTPELVRASTLNGERAVVLAGRSFRGRMRCRFVGRVRLAVERHRAFTLGFLVVEPARRHMVPLVCVTNINSNGDNRLFILGRIPHVSGASVECA